MTAYGAVISLKNTIHYILYSSHFSLSTPSPTIIQLAYNELQPLQDILGRLDKTRTSRSRKKVNALDGRIKDKIWEFEDKLESLLHQQILSQFPDTDQVDGDGGIKETRVPEFQGSLLESSSHIPSQFELQNSPPQQVEEITTRRRRSKYSLLFSDDIECLKEDIVSLIQMLKDRKKEYSYDFAAEQVEFKMGRSRDKLLFSIDLQCLEDDVASFIQAIKNMEEEYIYELENMPQEPFLTRIGFDFGGTKSKSKMIGLSDLLETCKGYLMGEDDEKRVQQSDLMVGLSDLFEICKGHLMGEYRGIIVQQIMGMAGIGKTTLAKELYEDADIMSHFDHRAWVTVTRTMVDEGPQFDEVLHGILAQLCGDTLIQGDQNIGDDLKGKKCLIVLDDLWEAQILDCVRKSLPDIKNGLFVILLTTRGIDLSVNRNTKARFLTDEESKELLCEKVFGDKEICPPELDKAATKIAKKCEGLPLMIVTVADILSKSQNREPEYWNDVAEERNSVFTDAYNEISKVLFPSYDYLPQYLKMPFLYMGVIPPDHETPQSKLMNMLNAEGWFFDTTRKRSLKDCVGACLHHLCMSRNLVLFKRKSIYWYIRRCDSIYKTCWLHSSWRYVCRGEARKNKFYPVLHTLVESSEEGVIGQRGLCLQNNILFGIKEFCNSIRLNCASFARSLLFLGPYHQYPTPVDVGFKLLRQLDALQLRFYTFPTHILTLVQLKYLALTCNGELPTTISKLFNLQVLIIHPHMNIRHCRTPSYVPVQIWDMQELEHIEILGKSLSVPNHDASFSKLSTLIGVNANICTIVELSRRIPNIRKLGVQIELMPADDHNDLLSCFACISTLESLKTLKCSIINPVIYYEYIVPAPPSSLMFPRGLRKLHLSGMGFPWEYMDVIGSLRDLEVLKLRSYAFQGSNWKAPQAQSFRRLKFLLIEDTNLVCLNLSRSLSRVTIRHCYKLERIHWPACGYEDRKIELVDCNPLALTWAKELKPCGFSFLHVTISSSFEDKPVIFDHVRPEEFTPLLTSSCTDDMGMRLVMRKRIFEERMMKMNVEEEYDRLLGESSE